MATTTPKNTLTIKTSNSQDWSDYSTNTNPIISSKIAVTTNVPGTSLLQHASSAQTLIFSWKAPFSSVTTFSSAGGTTITNKWGIMIMMNPSIEFDSATNPAIQSVQQTANTLTPSVSSVVDPTAYNRYTMIKMTGSIVDNLQNIFQTTATKTAFGLYPFKVKPISSLYSDNNCLDFMVATVDGIDGPQNKMTYNGYFLINGFTQVPAAANNLNMGFINYQATTAMDGSSVPTLLRVKGTIPDNTTQLDSLVVFFDSLTPFFSNKHAGEVVCNNTDNNFPCLYKQGPLTLTSGLNEKYNYLTLPRF